MSVLRAPRLSVPAKLFLTAWIVYSLHFATDIVREHYPAFTIAESGTMRVDGYLGLHPDLFEIEGRGAFINNNPGASLVGSIPYVLARPAVDVAVGRVLEGRKNAETPAFDDPRPNRRRFFEQTWTRGLDVRFGLAAGIVQAFGFAPITAASVVLMFFVLRRFGFEARQAQWLALLYAFGTPIFFRTGFLNHNLLVAHATLGCFALLYEPGRIVDAPARLFAAGAAIGFGLLCDYAGAMPVLVMGLYALAKLASHLPFPAAVLRMFWMVGGACVPIAVLLGYQYWAFGNPFFPAQHYMPPTEFSVHGWNGFDWPALDLLTENLIDRRFGLFAFGPLLLLAFLAPLLARRSGATPRIPRAEVALAFGLFFALLLFTSANQFARLQWNTGFRMLAPLVPLLFVLAADALTRLPRALAVALATLAVLHSWCIAMLRADAIESVRAVLSGGPRLPWLTSVGRAGEAYLPAGMGGTAWLATGFLLFGALLIALVWSRETRVPAVGSPDWRSRA